ncbi:hypothetical protein QUF70_09635 [Desulfobacterales bacterium HSG17]|nr:hypothetical protein [Desulfobacterales bacterium HSG17]
MNDFSDIITKIRHLINQNNYKFTVHALARCIERDISPDEIKETIKP